MFFLNYNDVYINLYPNFIESILEFFGKSTQWERTLNMEKSESRILVRPNDKNNYLGYVEIYPNVKRYEIYEVSFVGLGSIMAYVGGITGSVIAMLAVMHACGQKNQV